MDSISKTWTRLVNFDGRIKAIRNAFPVVQRECLTLSISNVTRECLRKAAEILRGKNGQPINVLFLYCTWSYVFSKFAWWIHHVFFL